MSPPTAALMMLAAREDLKPDPDFNRLSMIVPILAAIKTQISMQVSEGNAGDGRSTL
jgi:hypothetical protein